ncbi:MAG: sulfur-carrier protein [Frankiales bacterium]|jgi:MoaD family protein|nr:sulfur-carrier protein [Frankiales bacterium]
MAVEVRIPTILRNLTGNQKQVQGEGDTLEALFADLETKFAGLRGRLVDDEGALRRFVNVYLNDEDVRFLGGLETKLGEGDTVTILPAVAGG